MNKYNFFSGYVFLMLFSPGCIYWLQQSTKDTVNVQVIDSEKILEISQQGKEVLKNIAAFDKKLISALDIDQKVIAVREKDLLKLSKNENSQKELISLQNLFFLNVQKAKDLIQKHKKNEIIKFCNEVMMRWSQFNLCDIVLDSSSDIVLYSKNRVNVTDKIIDRLQNEFEAHKKCYSTKFEIQKLFEKLGLIYLKNIKVDDNLVNFCNAYKTNYYLQNQEKLNQDSQKYFDQISNYVHAPFCIKWISDQVGFGVFATAIIKEGQFIQEYTGVLHVPYVVKEDTSYTWDYPALSNNHNKLHLDSKYQGNEMRFVNHSDNPNAIRCILIGRDNLFHVCYVAKHEIQIGEQILVNYGKNYWNTRKIHQQLNF